MINKINTTIEIKTIIYNTLMFLIILLKLFNDNLNKKIKVTKKLETNNIFPNDLILNSEIEKSFK